MTQSTAHTRVLVTGAQGHLARHTIAAWLRDDADAVILGVGRAPGRDAVFPHALHRAGAAVPAPVPHALREALRAPRYRYERVEPADHAALADVLREFRPSVVVHLEGALSDERPGDTVAVLEALGASGIAPPRVVLAAPVHTAGDTLAALLVAARRAVPLVRARIFDTVGAGQDERALCAHLVAQAVAVARGEAPPVIAAKPPAATRDFIDVRDVARALRVLALRGASGRAYDVASGTEVHLAEALRLVLRAAGVGAPVRIVPRAGCALDVAPPGADVAPLASLGWAPEVALAESLEDVVAYYRDELAAGAAGVERAGGHEGYAPRASDPGRAGHRDEGRRSAPGGIPGPRSSEVDLAP